NDVYRVEGVDAGENGGLARLRTLRADLEEEAPDLLTLHAGDFLFPSLLSSAYRGAQMVDVLNLLDGDDAAFDGRLFVVFGNHEFDRAALGDAAMLDQRIEESGFTWLGTNVEFAAGDDGRPLVEADNLVPTAILESDGVRVGIFGITTGVKHPEYVASFGDPVEVARRAVRELRSGGAEVVVALTHQTVAEDRAMVEALGEDRPDVVVGGHEHERTVETAAGVPILKADAEARTATVIELSLPAGGGAVEVDHRFVTLDADVAEDPEVAARVEEWIARHDREFCAGAGEPPGCLGEELALARAELVAEELEIRRFETNFGSWIADRALAAYRPQGADLAFVNAGSIRLNQDVPAGTWVTRRHVEELFPYPGNLELLEIDGATLQQVLDHAVSDWTGVGWWLQVAGLAFRHDPTAGTATDLTLVGETGPRPIRPDDRLLVVTGSYLVDPSGDQDGYRMLGPAQRVPGAPTHDLKQLVVEALRAAGEAGIAPEVEGRICNPERPGPCLAAGP
ncbi:MAG TPA: bifunctional metallophosphatase/5'-nucleotidase, partial [Thermoanaerobaculia bacterium]|nr:bifunctional metallophosphatase/5'-nucleotidase [Thermoanaerobaculia bacterium]